MKRLCAILLTTVILVSVLCANTISWIVSADESQSVTESQPNDNDSPTIMIDKAYARAGENVSVMVRINNNPGIVALRLQLTYDNTVMTLLSAEEQALAGVFFGPISENPIRVLWTDAAQPNNTTNGVVALFTFSVREDAPVGESLLKLSLVDPDDIYNAAWETVSFDIVSSTMNVVDYDPGDISEDGEINNRDIALLQRYLAGWPDLEICEAAADMNGDGKVNTRDYGLLQQYLCGWDVTLEHEGSNVIVPTISLELVTDQTKILEDAFTLGKNEYTPYIAQLTGTVLSVEKYDAEHGSVTLTMKVGDKTIECYQMKGNGIDRVKSGDTITVKGVIKNYYYEGATKGTVEFAWHEASGTEVTLTKLVAAATQDLSTPAKIVAAAKALKEGESLQKEVTLTGKVLDVEMPYDANYGNITVNFTVENTTIKCYRMKGDGIDKIKGGDTITVKGTIKNYMGIIEFDNGCEMTQRVDGTNINKKMSVVDSPKTGIAYKFGMVQANVSEDAVYYLKGGMAGYYMATTTSTNMAIDVYLENTDGGFYLYTEYSGSKQYINMVVNGTHVDGVYETTAKTVYTYDSTAMTLTAEFDGAPYWFGTRNDKSYTTVGPCKTEYEGFYCQVYEEDLAE